MRALFVVVLGAVTAFGLFWVMQELIAVKFAIKDPGARLTLNIVRLKEDTPPETPPRKPHRWQKPEAQPTPPEITDTLILKPGEALREFATIMDTRAQLKKATDLGPGGTDRDIVPLIRVDPDYPPRAKQRGIEGWVEVEFTISAVGTVTDAVVIGARPPFIFDRAALQAIRKWKYTPRIEKGVSASRPGVMVRLRFDLSKRGR